MDDVFIPEGWPMCGFPLTVYGNSWFLWRWFRPYFAGDEEGGRTGSAGGVRGLWTGRIPV